MHVPLSRRHSSLLRNVGYLTKCWQMFVGVPSARFMYLDSPWTSAFQVAFAQRSSTATHDATPFPKMAVTVSNDMSNVCKRSCSVRCFNVGFTCNPYFTIAGPISFLFVMGLTTFHYLYILVIRAWVTPFINFLVVFKHLMNKNDSGKRHWRPFDWAS